jgi:ketosteroid isomerase-like protein
MDTADVALALSLVTDDVIHVSPSGDRRVGRADLGRALDAFHRAYAERVQWSVESITFTTQGAEVRVKEIATIRPRDGSSSIRAAGSHIARIVPTTRGGWLIAQDIGHLDGEPIKVPHEFELGGA